MKFDLLPINWFDVFLLVWLGMGLFRGRKRGMSVEVMTFMNWFVIVIACAVAYEPLGRWLAQTAQVFGLLFSYVIAYLVTAGAVAIVFVLFKRSFGGKLVGSDAFGRGEYYLGMPAGVLRFFCILLTALALLNARFYSRQEIQGYQKFQLDNYGSEFFPGFQALQVNVFEKSFTGPYFQKYLGFLLIKPTPPTGGKQLKQQEWKM